jgi:hypothetical protein
VGGLVRGEEEGNRTSYKAIISHVTELRCLQFPETGRLKDSLYAKYRKGERKVREKKIASLLKYLMQKGSAEN